MYQVRRATGVYYYDIFFILTVELGAYLVLNLMIAVQFEYLDVAFTEINDKKLKDAAAEKAELLENTGGDDVQEEKKPTCIERCTPNKDICPASVNAFRAKLRIIVEHQNYTIVVIVFILLNSVVLATEHYEQSELLGEIQDTSNTVFTFIFLVETLLRLLALGPCDYVRDGFNVFDAIVVAFSLIEFLKVGAGFSMLRGFRLLRIFKIIRNWTSLKALLQTVIKSLPSITNLGMLIFLYMFIYSLIGKSYFSGDMLDSEGALSRYHFNTMMNSMLVMFILLTGENWNEIMRTLYNAHGWTAIIFVESALIIGNFIMLNLFLAILLKYIEEEDIEEEGEAKKITKEEVKEG
jgi:hypothetical protein